MALDSYADVKAFCLRRAEEPTDGTSDWDGDADNALVDAWRDLYVRHPWIDFEVFPPQALLLEPALDKVLTAAVGTGVTGTLSATHATSLTGYVVIPQGSTHRMIRITAHTGGSASVTLDAVDEALSAEAVKIVKVEYDVAANTGIFINGLWGPAGEFIPIRDDEERRSNYTDPPGQGFPDFAVRVAKLKLRFTHYPDQYYRLEAPYCKEPTQPSGSSALEISAHLRPIFADLGTYQLLLLKSDPTRAAQYQARAEAKIERAIIYEERLRMTLGRGSRQTVTGPYHASGGRRYRRIY